MVWDESRLLVEHLNGAMATNAILTQLAIASMFSSEGGKQFQKRIKGLTNGE